MLLRYYLKLTHALLAAVMMWLRKPWGVMLRRSDEIGADLPRRGMQYPARYDCTTFPEVDCFGQDSPLPFAIVKLGGAQSTDVSCQHWPVSKPEIGMADTHILLMDSAAELLPGGLAAMAMALQENPGASLIYADYKMGTSATPVFMPPWSAMLLQNAGFPGPAVLVSKELLRSLGKLGSAQSVNQVCRELNNSLGRNAVVHVSAFLAKSETAALEPCGGPTTPGASETHQSILVSVLIPTRDGYPLIRNCIDSLQNTIGEIRWELVVINNGSKDPATLDYLQNIECASADRVVVINDGRAFNYSRLMNQAAACASGDYLLWLNDDVEFLAPGWLESMLAHVERPGVGAVGAQLRYPDGRIQHAGVTLGLGGVAGHHLAGLDPEADTQWRLWHACSRPVDAVTGACLLTSRSLFAQLGGLNERRLAVAFNDVDYCLRARELGLEVIYDARAICMHLESASRGAEDTWRKRFRFVREVCWMKARWGAVL